VTGLDEGGMMTVVGGFEVGGWRSPQASNRRRWLNQSTYSRVAISTCSTVRQGPRGFDQFGLEQPDHALGQGVVVGVADRPHRRVDARLGQVLGVGDGGVLGSGVVLADQPGQEQTVDSISCRRTPCSSLLQYQCRSLK
jgi:hypothetical protein